MEGEKVSFRDWLEFDKMRREIQFSLQEAFDKLLGQFSFLRLEGLKSLHKIVCSLNEEETMVFSSLQDDTRHNVLFRVIPLILVRKKFPPKGDISDEEKIWALELTHIICLIHPKSKKHFNINVHMEPLMAMLQTEKLQFGALQAFESLLCESKDIQESFERTSGMKIVAKLMLQSKAPVKSRAKCAELLYLMLTPDQNYSLQADPGNDERSRNITAYLGEKNFEMFMQNFDLLSPEESATKLLTKLE